ncbi:hypothetical protein JL722_1618 [Aureococcus anophagefferens]|nr:hypothetical protein JL722_1618 [Aureococcus anophagefferens]
MLARVVALALVAGQASALTLNPLRLFKRGASEHDLSEKLGLEDHAAVSCAIQNFMLSLADDGVGSKWMTGALGAAPEDDVMACVGAPDGEKLMGAIWFGYPAKDLADDAKSPPRKKGLDGVLTNGARSPPRSRARRSRRRRPARARRVGVAAAYLVVELRFHAALGWHRDVLCAWTLVAERCPRAAGRRRACSRAHSYGGSGYRRWRAGGGPDAAALRAVFEGAATGGNVVAPRLADIGRGLPDAALVALDGASRAGLEILGVGFLIAGRRSPGVRGGFRAAAAAFHFAVGLATAIDFLENRVVLLAGFVGDDARAPVAAPSCSTLAARLYALALFLPVAAGCEHFPLTHNGLFPYSGSQMAALGGPEEHEYRSEEWGADASLSSFAELYGRVSELKSREIAADRLSAYNWRAGAMGEMAVVELEDTRVCMARLHGNTVAFGTAAGVVVLVDLDEGLVLDGFDAHEGEVTALEWTGEKLVSGGADGSVVVSSPDVDGGGENALFELTLEDFALRPTDPDGDAALARTRLLHGIFPEAPSDAIIVDRGGDRGGDDDLLGAVLTHGESLEDELLAGDKSDGEPDVVLKGHGARVTGVKALGDDAILSASLDRRLLLWDVADGRHRVVAECRSPICCLAVADGVAVVGLLDGAVVAYDIDTGRVNFELAGAHEGAVRSLHFEAEAEDVPRPTAAASSPEASGAAPRRRAGAVSAVYRERRCGKHALEGHGGAIVALQADDAKLVSASIDGTVRCWDLKSGDQLFKLDGHSRHINSLHFQGDLLVADGTQGTVIVHDFSGREV